MTSLTISGGLALLAGAGVLAAGCGGSDEPAGRAADQTIEQRSSSGKSRIEQKQSGDGVSQSSSQSSQSSGGGSQSLSQTQSSSGTQSQSSSQSSGGTSVKSFAGTGRQTVSFNVEEPSRFTWTEGGGGRFEAEGDGISISSSSGGGEVELEPGNYENVRVSGGSWTITVRPR